MGVEEEEEEGGWGEWMIPSVVVLSPLVGRGVVVEMKYPVSRRILNYDICLHGWYVLPLNK